jgi:hypothetical protein
VSGAPLHRIEAPAAGSLLATPEAFLASLPGPTLLRVPGRDRTRARAFTTLLHGNEPSGLRALHGWLRDDPHPEVDALCLVGAVEAARTGSGFAHRMRPGERDLNRCFHPPFLEAGGALAEAILAALRDAGCEALVDVHNNTGHNPPYAVATRIDLERLALAALFAERFIHCDLHLGTLIEATEDDFPGLTLECGRAGDPAADATARAVLDAFFATPALPTKPERHLVILHEPVRVCLRDGVRVAFGEGGPRPDADLTVAGDIDRHNFQAVAPGTPVGWLRDPTAWPLEAHGADGSDVSREFFREREGRLEIARDLVPIMMTTDSDVASADCLFYAVRPRDVEP